MKIHTLGWLVAIPALALPCISSCSQASTVCVAAHAGTPGADQFGTPIGVGFAATFSPKAAPRGCGMTNTYSMPYGPGPTFGRQDVPLAEVKGDIIGFETYHPQKKTAEGVEPDFSTGLVAWQADALGVTRLGRDPDPSKDRHAYAQGTWTSIEPDADGICTVKDVKPAEQDFPKVDAVPPMDKDPGSPEIPASTVKYEWTNLKLYVTAAAQGTQFSADLTYTQDSCSADFHVRGIWPLVGCIKLDKDGNPADASGKAIPTDDDGNLMGPMVPDDSLCCPDPDPSVGRAFGSGINPDFPTKCDPKLLYCVLDAPDTVEIPVLGGSKLAACKSSAQ